SGARTWHLSRLHEMGSTAFRAIGGLGETQVFGSWTTVSTPQMSGINIETKRKLHGTGATALLKMIDAQDETEVLNTSFDDRLQLVFDESATSLNHPRSKACSAVPGCVSPATTFIGTHSPRNGGQWWCARL